MAEWKKVLTHNSAVSDTDGLKINAADGANTSEEKIVLSDGSNTDEVVIAAGTGLSIARSGDTITLTNTETDTTLTTEEVQDIVGGMIDVNNNLGINVSYGDTDGDLSFAVSSNHFIVTDQTGEVVRLSKQNAGGNSASSSVDFEATGGLLTLSGTQGSSPSDLDEITIGLTEQAVKDALTDLSLEVTTDGTGANITFTGPGGETEVLNLNTSGGVTITATNDDTITLATDGVGTVDITDSDTDELAHLVFTTATSGSGALKVDSSTLSYNASSDTLFVNNLTVSGTQTTVQTADLVVEDKNIILGNPDTAYADDTAAQTGANGGGISLVSDSSGIETDYAAMTWSSTGDLTGWRFRDTAGATDFAASIMEFSSNSTAPTGDAGGVGSFHFDSGNDKLYIRIS